MSKSSSISNSIPTYEDLLGSKASYEILQQWGFSAPIIEFLRNHAVVPDVVNSWNFPFEEIVKSHPNGQKLQRSEFLNTGESSFYSKLIEFGLRHFKDKGIELLIDYGCGSSVPTLGAMSAVRDIYPNLRLVGVDLDEEAIAISKKNSELLELENRTQFFLKDIHTFLESSPRGKLLVSANPPYVPVPPSLTDPFFTPIAAGGDGLKYLLPILKKEYKAGTVLVVLAGSFTSPSVLIQEIQSNYKIVKVESYVNKFGPYTRHEALLPYLIQIRENGKMTFGEDPKGTLVSLVFGFVLERK